MTDLISRELGQVLVMFCCGMGIMLIFSARDYLIRRIGANRRLARTIYLISWISAGFLFSEFTYRGSHGVITLYGILSMTVGILLWKKIIYDIIKEV